MKKQVLSLTLVLALALAFAPKMAPPASAIGENFAAVSAGTYHTMAVKTDGSLWGWGHNDLINGQLGDGKKGNRYAPVKIMGGVVSVSVGSEVGRSHTMAVKIDGSLWAWGDNEFGQLGDGTRENRDMPVKVMDDVASVSAGGFHTVAIKTDGSLWAWGQNRSGQLGDGTRDDCPTPMKIMDGVTFAAAGGDYSMYTLAVKTDGSLWAWGRNDFCQLGDGTSGMRKTPVKIIDSGVVSVTANYSALAVKTDGSLWGWGANWAGALGDGTTEPHKTPVKLMDAGQVASVSAGTLHTVAVKTDGSLWVWGSNQFGRIGDGTANVYAEDGETIIVDNDRHRPVKIMGAGEAASASAGGSHTVAVKTDGSLWAWGDNGGGKLGDDTADDRHTPVKIMDEGEAATAAIPLPGIPSGWAAPQVEKAIGENLVPLSLQSKYTTDITRAEFCALAVAVYEGYTGKTVAERKTFPDTLDINVQKMAGLGVAGGNADGMFNPGGTFTRQEAAVLFVKLLNALDIELEKAEADFPDKGDIPGWALTQVGQMQKAELMQGTGAGTFDPSGKFTRESGIILMLKLWDYLNK